MRTRSILAMVMIVLISTSFSSARQGGEGDGIRSMQCGGSCHSDTAQNATSAAFINVSIPTSTWAGLLTTVDVTIEDFPESESRLVGIFLLINTDGAKDTPAHGGWQIVADPNGGESNYIEVRIPNGEDSLTVTLTLKLTFRYLLFTFYYALFAFHHLLLTFHHLLSTSYLLIFTFT